MSEFDPYEELEKQKAEAEARFAAEADGARMTVMQDQGMYRQRPARARPEDLAQRRRS